MAYINWCGVRCCIYFYSVDQEKVRIIFSLQSKFFALPKLLRLLLLAAAFGGVGTLAVAPGGNCSNAGSCTSCITQFSGCVWCLVMGACIPVSEQGMRTFYPSSCPCSLRHWCRAMHKSVHGLLCHVFATGLPRVSCKQQLWLVFQSGMQARQQYRT